MATTNAEQLGNTRRKADGYTARNRAAQNRRNAARPAWQPYEPQGRGDRTPPRPQRNEEDYHPPAPLKTLTGAEIRAICLVIIVITAISMCIILLAAEATVTQKEINDLKRNITQVDDDIANLKIEIEQSQNMQLIKTRAQELGLQEPLFDQYVYVSELAEVGPGFGQYIKERAYGGARNQTAEPEAQ